MKKKIFKSMLAVMLLGCLCMGCGSTDNVEQKVAAELENLAEQTQTQTEEATPEPALDYLEVDAPDEALITEKTLDSVAMEQSTADNQGNTETVVIQEELSDNDDPLQIVFLGDSIFDAVRDETGIASLVGKNLEADIYNLAIGGTTAGLRTDKSTDKATWNEPNLMGVLYTMQGEVTNGLLDGYKSGEVLKTLDSEKTDYFIIEYGTNDFLWYIPLGAADYKGQYYFYFRTALDKAIELLQGSYPEAKIILCTPYYEEFWSADRTRYIGDAHSTNNGYGTLLDYISVAKDAARAHGVKYLDMYDLMGIDIYNINDMTVDGIHPSEQARVKYAQILIDTIKEMEGEVVEQTTESDGTSSADGNN